jgi:hypothetical protein
MSSFWLKGNSQEFIAPDEEIRRLERDREKFLRTGKPPEGDYYECRVGSDNNLKRMFVRFEDIGDINYVGLSPRYSTDSDQ